jgi:hypothetical protein
MKIFGMLFYNRGIITIMKKEIYADFYLNTIGGFHNEEE